MHLAKRMKRGQSPKKTHIGTPRYLCHLKHDSRDIAQPSTTMQLKYLISVIAAIPLAFAQSCPNADGVSIIHYPGCHPYGCMGPTSTVYAATFTATNSVDCAGCTSVVSTYSAKCLVSYHAFSFSNSCLLRLGKLL